MSSATESVISAGVRPGSNDAIFGFSPPSTMSPSCMYGPKRPFLTYTGRLVSGSFPKDSGPLAASARSCSAVELVNSSNGSESGTLARFSPSDRKGPYRPTRTSRSCPVEPFPSPIPQTTRGSMFSSPSVTRSLRPFRLPSSPK